MVTTDAPWAELAAVLALILACAGELLHAARVRAAAGLLFGPSRRPAAWALAAPPLRVVALAAASWGLTTLALMPPAIQKTAEVPEHEVRHLVLVLDVSPSMNLEDGGPTGKLRRKQRAAEVLDSFYGRVAVEKYKTTVVAFYTSAKPVVLDTTDLEVVRNFLVDLPMSQAFKNGPTDLLAGLNEAARIARPWPPGSATLLVVTDGDSVPATGMPKMPASVAQVAIIGVGDPVAGKYIDGHQSRQDASTLRQVAVRTGGTYHNANEKHLPSDLVAQLDRRAAPEWWKQLTRREYALMAAAGGSAVLALLPVLLQFFGTGWRPGVRAASSAPPTRRGRARESLDVGRLAGRAGGGGGLALRPGTGPVGRR